MGNMKRFSIYISGIVLIVTMYSCTTKQTINSDVRRVPLVETDEGVLIDLSLYASVQGIVFNKEAETVGAYKGMVGRFTPGLDDILKAEDLIIDSCKNVNLEKQEYVCYIIEHSKTFKRQYMGRLNDKEEKVLEIQFLNFSEKHSEEEFEGWEKLFLLATGTFFNENTHIIMVNLEQEKVYIP